MKRMLLTHLILALFILSCEKDTTPGEQNSTASIESLFELKSVKECGIDFNNTIIETKNHNYFAIDVIVNGGGVAVVDINNDGLLDVFFAGNQVSDRLYLNKGDLKFEDITVSAGIQNKTWSTAIAIADVNNDGWQDIYVGKFILEDPEKRQNALYINNGDLTFTESAAAYGLDHNGHCTAVNFFDYDLDGDLDLYVGIEPFVKRQTKYNKNYKFDEADYTDRLFRNDGGRFQDVTVAAGLQNFNYTLSVTVGDLNHDGWPDLYVASDYEEPDYYYLNNGNGTFNNHVHTGMRHISNFSMGTDLADFNNDGWVDIVVADMAPEDNYRSKANMSGMNPKKFWGLANNGYHHQYMFNTLQMNNGNGTYSEIGHLSNIAKTDWSWATLFGDYDLDGDKDLFITNGQLHDVRNKDFKNKLAHIVDSIKTAGGTVESFNALPYLKDTPQERLRNYMFLNDGKLGFNNEANKLGLKENTFSQGAAYADLDNDGDLDLLVNNMNDRAFLYENHATEQTGHHFLSVKLKGENRANANAYGAKVWLFSKEGHQLQEVNPVRGYMSSTDPVLSFGLGTTTIIDRLVVQWPGGKVTELANVKTDQRIVLDQKDGIKKFVNLINVNPPIFTDFVRQSKIDYTHQENKFDDFKDEVLLPHRMSRLGPSAAKADVNGDGLEDAFLGGAAGYPGTLFLQQADNTLLAAPNQPWKADAASEDIHAHFFDADNDGDADLYITSGGNEFAINSPRLQDRLYINKGNGVFTKSTNQLPTIRTSGGVCTSGDLDGDGDLDLFIGGRQVPGKYGFPAQSFILRNDNGHFEDISEEMGINLNEMGMVTDAAWTDLDGDKDQDLVILGEWMPITIFINESGKLVNKTKESGFEKSNGWWNRLALADMDNDGDVDIIAGNLGLNIKFKASKEKPFAAYIKDFDENGSNDTYLAYYDASGKVFPVRGRQCSSEQMSFVSDEFSTYHDFALATVEQVLGDRMEGAIKHEAYEFKTLYFENNGNAQFISHELPAITQSFPVNGIIPRDWNNDGKLDLLLAGNFYEREIETTRSDAGIGLVLLGDGKGGFEALPPYETGMFAYLDVKNLILLENKQKPLVLIVNNNTGVQVYR